MHIISVWKKNSHLTVPETETGHIFLHMTRIAVFMELKPTRRVNMTQCGKKLSQFTGFLWALHLIMMAKKNVMLKLESGFMKFGREANRGPWAVRLVAVSLPQQQQRAAELPWRPAPSSSSSGKNLSPPCDALPAWPRLFLHPWTPL